MKYFKPELVSDSKSDKAAWATAQRTYGEYVSGLLPALSSEMQEYIGLGNFHDDEINGIEHDEDLRTLRIRIGRNNVLDFVGVKRVDFSGLPLSDAVSDVWLYDEVEQLRNKNFEFRILLEGGELKIEASSVQLR